MDRNLLAEHERLLKEWEAKVTSPKLGPSLNLPEQRNTVRKFETGATRDLDTSKYDFEGFLSPRVLEAFGKYMHKHRHLADGSLRDSDNWQKGIPADVYMKSLWRHFFELWRVHRGGLPREAMEDTLAAIMFNTMGYFHEWLKRDMDGHGNTTSHP